MLSDPRPSFPAHVVRELLAFSQGEYARFFQGCGLYHVGSSLNSASYNDVDIVIAGMDFRAVIEYDKIFLQDPETLIAQEIVVEPYRFLVEATDEKGEPTVLTPTTDKPDADPVWAFMLRGIEHEGKVYDYNNARFAGEGLSLDSFCSYHARPSKLVRAFEEHVRRMPANVQGADNPFEPYSHNTTKFIVTRTGILPRIRYRSNLPVRTDVPDTEVRIPPIDFMFHAQNLHKSAWEERQRELSLPFNMIYEWPALPDSRPVITDLPLPGFVDENGQKTYFYICM